MTTTYGDWTEESNQLMREQEARALVEVRKRKAEREKEEAND